jgi:hypothetical protein
MVSAQGLSDRPGSKDYLWCTEANLLREVQAEEEVWISNIPLVDVQNAEEINPGNLVDFTQARQFVDAWSRRAGFYLAEAHLANAIPTILACVSNLAASCFYLC